MPGSESHTDSRRRASSGSLTESILRIWREKCQPYAADYIGLAIIVPIWICLQLFIFTEPFHRMFSLDDRRIQYPHAEIEHVPVPWLLIYAGLFPFLVLLIWSFAFFKNQHKTHVTLLGFGISLLVTLFVTDVIKNAVGRPRPDLLSRCHPAPGTPTHELLPYTVCTNPNHHVLHDGWRSFPSGHSSFAFSGLGYLSFFLISQFRILHPRAGLYRTLVAFSPFLGAALIAISRLEDYRHDVFDVVVGSGLGLGVGYGCWRRWFPALSSQGCAEPHAAFEDGEEQTVFERIRDEEEMMGQGFEMQGRDDGGYLGTAVR
ncbi:PAP2-domain-containing protein [Aureobasidium sp. EXF-3400]|nr:PAP2-domain-containing protein [Aureobasidium sp. EXF-12344]KAI4784965.1 PAP2-domain-containing protein [Aureobasidium sp. EXF-3400]